MRGNSSHERTVLVFGARTDDQEVGAGGTVARLAQDRARVILIDLEDPDDPTRGVAPGFHDREAKAAALILSAPPTGEHPASSVTREKLALPYRDPARARATALETARVLRRERPALVLGPDPVGAHPDHGRLADLLERARHAAADPSAPIEEQPLRIGPALRYHLPGSGRIAEPSLVTDISSVVDQKRRSIESYHSLYVLPDAGRERLASAEAMTRYFGSRIGAAHGEPLSTTGPIGLDGLGGLLV
ncbi:MAG: PIG-L family deacetylase [Planctomycetota bacterium]